MERRGRSRAATRRRARPPSRTSKNSRPAWGGCFLLLRFCYFVILMLSLGALSCPSITVVTRRWQVPLTEMPKHCGYPQYHFSLLLLLMRVYGPSGVRDLYT